MEYLIRALGRYLFAIPFLLFGIMHLVNARGMAAIVPHWIPGGAFWVISTGLILIGASISIMIKKWDHTAALVLGITLLTFALTVHLPNTFSDPLGSMNDLLKDIALAGAAWLYAGHMARSFTPMFYHEETHGTMGKKFDKVPGDARRDIPEDITQAGEQQRPGKHDDRRGERRSGQFSRSQSPGSSVPEKGRPERPPREKERPQDQATGKPPPPRPEKPTDKQQGRYQGRDQQRRRQRPPAEGEKGEENPGQNRPSQQRQPRQGRNEQAKPKDNPHREPGENRSENFRRRKRPGNNPGGEKRDDTPRET